MREQFVQDKHNWMVGETPITVRPTGKFPVVANLQWNTLEDLLDFVKDDEDTAIVGMVVTVVNDPIEDNNGTYQVDAIGPEGSVSKLAEHIYKSSVPEHWHTEEIGDIPAGLYQDESPIYDRPIHDILDLLLYKTIQPVVEKEVSTYLKYDGDLVVTVGTSLPSEDDFDVDYCRGLVTYPYTEEMLEETPDKYFYAGDAKHEWLFEGPEAEEDHSLNFGHPMHVEGAYKITYKVDFEPGEELWDNKRQLATELEKYPGGTIEKSITIHAVKPMYSNCGDSVDADLEQILVDYVGVDEENEDGVSFWVEIQKETEDRKFEVYLPEGTELVSVYQYNTISDTYNIPITMEVRDNFPTQKIGEFNTYDVYVRTNVAKDIQGASKYQITIKRQ